MKKSLPLILLLLFVWSACSEDTNDPKYRSDCPRFSSFTFSADPVRAGEDVTLTAVQSKAGHLLDKTTYSWEVQPADGVTCEPSQPEGGVYDGKNPECALRFPNAGTYTITFKGDYKGSGQVNYFEESATLEDGTTARYSANTNTGTGASRDYLHATLTRSVTVVE